MPLTSAINDSALPETPPGTGSRPATPDQQQDSAPNTSPNTSPDTSPDISANAKDNELQRLFDLVSDDFAAVNSLIPRQLTSDVDLVESIGRYIVESGGKRLRPLIVLLGARLCGYTGNKHVRLAAIIEFLHTATLLHDDVVDRSGLRRGRATANALWGNAPSVLVGDFLYSRAFQLMVELESIDVMAILADATNVIAEGEVMQLANIGNADLTEESYREVIRCKTAMLFQAAAHASAVLAAEEITQDNPDDSHDSEAQDAEEQEAEEQIERLRDFGLHFGTAYQLVDDWLDYAGDAEVMGKNVGDDLAEGKATLPLIHTIAEGEPADAALVREALESKCADRLDAVCQAVKRNGALEYTRIQAKAASQRAIDALLGLPANKFRDALEDLTHAAVARIS